MTVAAPPLAEAGTARLREIVRRPLVTCPLGTPVQAAAQAMTREEVGSIVVADGARLVGIITDSDLRRRVVAAGRPPDTPVEQIMSAPLITIEADALLFEAVYTMLRHGIHHLVVCERGAAVGLVGDLDLLGAQREGPLYAQRQLEQARALDQLVALGSLRARVARWLVHAQVGAWDVARLLAELQDTLTRRVLAFAEAALGPPPVPYCWLGLGSEGRREQALKTDQDNALVYADPPPAEAAAARDYFARLGVWVVDALARCGVPRCPGDVMASNARWCQPLSTWRDYFARWIHEPEPAALLNAAICFDLRAVGGAAPLADQLWEGLRQLAPHARPFTALLLREALDRRPPLGFLRHFVVERSGEHAGAFDIKARGLLPIVEIARACALAAGITATNTVERLRTLRAHGALPPTDADDLVAAYTFLLDLRLRHHLAQLDAGQPLDNYIAPRQLSRVERRTLKEHFQVIADVQAYLAQQLGRSLAG